MKRLFILIYLFSTTVFADLSYFNTYEENKTEFLKLAGEHILPAWPLKIDPKLTTDLALYQNNSKRLIVFSSGLHGIEGYVGSSIQRHLMQNIKIKSADILMVHSMNPWGMKHKRRVNESNIDLNRNFSINQKIFENKNPDYLKIKQFLNPSEKLNIGVMHNLGFLFQSVKLILTYGMESLRKSILIGQYTEKNGLYFGGHQPTELQTHINDLIKTTFLKYQSIIWIDLHTGYGQKNKLHILSNDSKTESGQRISKLFKNQSIDFGDQKNFYKSTGDLCDYLNSKTSTDHQITAVVFEYGTMDSQNTLGSIESLRRMVIENQGFQNGYINKKSEQESKIKFADMFFPRDQDWQTSILKQTHEFIGPLLGL